MESDRPSGHPNNWRFHTILVPPGHHTLVLQMVKHGGRCASPRTEPPSYGAREAAAFWFLESPHPLQKSVAFPPGRSSLPTTKMRKSSMVHLVHYFTSLETPAGHSLAAELLAPPLLHSRLRFIQQPPVMSGSPPILDSSTPPTLGQPSRPSRTSLVLGPSGLALLPDPVGTPQSSLSRRSL
jgi:hypothetical protein